MPKSSLVLLSLWCSFRDLFAHLRLPTNKLLVGNLNSKNNYILHCGNIKMPCMPEKKIKCIKNIKKINGYLIITNNNNECLKLMNEEHALY